MLSWAELEKGCYNLGSWRLLLGDLLCECFGAHTLDPSLWKFADLFIGGWFVISAIVFQRLCLIFSSGTTVSLHIYGLHHNKHVWDKPMEYIPERFSKENVAKMDPYQFVPFSAGPRYMLSSLLWWRHDHVPGEDSDQPVHLHSLVKVFTDHLTVLFIRIHQYTVVDCC